MIVEILLIVFLLILDGLFSATETSLVVISDQKVDDAADEGKRQALMVQAFTKNSKPYVTAIHMLLTLFPILNGIFVHMIYLESVLPALNGLAVINTLVLIAMIASVLVFHVVLGALVSKTVAYKYADRLAYALVGFAFFARFMMRPLLSLVMLLSRALGKGFGLHPSDHERTMTEEEIRTIVEASSKTGVIDDDEREMIHNIFEFDDTTVDEIMTHRTEIASIDVEASRQDIIDSVTSEKYTRFPVYEQNIDQIIGTLHVKDLLPFLNKDAEPLDIRKLLRNPYFIPESKRISDLFKEMQRDKNHIAVVLDEYGGTAGIVTVEDLIEEIVGNIFDEYDLDEEEEIIKIDHHIYEIDGLINIDDVEDLLDIGLPIEDYDTISGFILGHLGRFPEDGEAVSFEYKNHLFEVLHVDDQVILKVRITRLDGLVSLDGEEGEDNEQQ